MGLKDEWGSIIEVLREVIPVYDRVNSVISLGKAEGLRILGITGGVKDGDLVLDAGSGFGNMSKSILRIFPNTKVIMLDPIVEMLYLASKSMKMVEGSECRVSLVSGVFEHIPFSDNTFDAIVCGYSFRDAMIMSDAIREFHRVLKDDGKLVIVDIGKPDDPLARLGATIYLRFILAMLAFLAAGRLGLRFAAIYDTYRRLPRNSELLAMLRERFSSVRLVSRMLGAAVIFIASK
ncbi:MAG: class I SAM-dependent methyltransferase [Candidatus Nitrosocaldus sp.]|nr:class I SAM-dependent methyltransferase [Candidatus Nitrosocaldus sp.]MDW7999646.1 class I SAM-dependent methyltransferase [Candidatus Nitrosocaldus sp.]